MMPLRLEAVEKPPAMGLQWWNGHRALRTHDLDHPLHVVGQHRQAAFSSELWQQSGQLVLGSCQQWEGFHATSNQWDVAS